MGGSQSWTPRCTASQQMQFSKYLLSALMGPSLAIDLRVYKEAIYRTRRLLVGNDVINHHELTTCPSHIHVLKP